MKGLAQQSFSSLARFELDQSTGLVRRQATGAAALALALAALALATALRAAPDFRSKEQDAFVRSAIIASTPDHLPATN
jgi:hypothetical protein